LVYENIAPARFQAELVDGKRPPEYKRDGFFVFSDLHEDEYTLKITGERLQPAILDVAIPGPSTIPDGTSPENEVAPKPVFLDSRGDNELIVIVRSAEDVGGNNGGRRINFDPMILAREIRAGALVVSNDLPLDPVSRLAVSLEVGRVSSARVENADGLDQGSIVRIIRDNSIRMKFDPYYSFASPITRVVGKVVSLQNPAAPLAGARVRVTKINDTDLTTNDVHGVEIFTGVDVNGNTVVLGVEKDISTLTNEKGDYNLYFSNETIASLKITDQTLANLESEGVPEDVRTKLGSLKDQLFRGHERFLAALRETLGGTDARKHGPLIQELAESFIRNLSLDATLEGYVVESKTESINTGQRKVIDFELAEA